VVSFAETSITNSVIKNTMKKAAINKLTRHKSTLTLVLCSLLGLTACSDDDQDSTTQKTLNQNITLAFGDEACVMGGTRMQSGLDRNGNGKLEASEGTVLNFV